MLRTIAAVLLLMGFLAAPLEAQSFRCRTTDGSLVFTDDPTKFPADCREEPNKPQESRGGVSVVPYAPSPTVKSEPSSESVPVSDRNMSGTSENKSEGGNLKQEALALAEEYREVVAQRVTSLPPAVVQKARERTLDILIRRADLQEKLSASPLSEAEKAEIETILSEIGGSVGY